MLADINNDQQSGIMADGRAEGKLGLTVMSFSTFAPRTLRWLYGPQETKIMWNWWLISS